MALLTLTPLALFGAGLVVLLLALAFAERRAARRHREQVLVEVQEARITGTDQAIAQHPGVDPLACVGCGACIRACPEKGVLELVEGLAVVVHGSRCVGHGLCEVACPVGALEVGLGDIAGRDDIPRLGPHQESSVPGLFLAGEVSGIALIRHAVTQGVAAVEEIARRGRPAPDAELLDVAIVGAGPAGLAAALAAKEKGLRHLVLDQESFGGTIRHYPRRKLVMTQPVRLPLYGRLKRHEYSKEELVQIWTDIVDRFELPIREQTRLESLQRGADGIFELHTSSGPLRARHVMLALGRRGTPRKLGVPGEDCEKIAYRLIDAATYRDARILVVGGGDSAVEAALALAEQRGNEVTLSYRRAGFFRIKRRNAERLETTQGSGRLHLLLPSEVLEIRPGEVSIRVGEGPAAEARSLPNDHVFVFAGGIPPFDLLRSAGVAFGAEQAPASPSSPVAAPRPAAHP